MFEISINLTYQRNTIKKLIEIHGRSVFPLSRRIRIRNKGVEE